MRAAPGILVAGGVIFLLANMLVGAVVLIVGCVVYAMERPRTTGDE